MNSYHIFLYFILFVKVLFAISMTLDLLNFGEFSFLSDEFFKKNHERKERLENLYLFLMSIMLIIVFRNRHKSSIKFIHLELELLFLLGLVLCFKLFFTWVRRFKEVIDADDKKDDNVDIIQDTIDVTTDIFIPLA